MLLFSATYEQEVMTFATSIIPDPVIIRLRKDQESLDNIKQYYVWCDNEEKKYEALANLYGVLTIGQSMVFCHVCFCIYIYALFLLSVILISFPSDFVDYWIVNLAAGISMVSFIPCTTLVDRQRAKSL